MYHRWPSSNQKAEKLSRQLATVYHFLSFKVKIEFQDVWRWLKQHSMNNDPKITSPLLCSLLKQPSYGNIIFLLYDFTFHHAMCHECVHLLKLFLLCILLHLQAPGDKVMCILTKNKRDGNLQSMNMCFECAFEGKIEHLMEL
jgi:hypothetical protein